MTPVDCGIYSPAVDAQLFATHDNTQAFKYALTLVLSRLKLG